MHHEEDNHTTAFMVCLSRHKPFVEKGRQKIKIRNYQSITIPSYVFTWRTTRVPEHDTSGWDVDCRTRSGVWGWLQSRFCVGPHWSCSSIIHTRRSAAAAAAAVPHTLAVNQLRSFTVSMNIITYKRHQLTGTVQSYTHTHTQVASKHVPISP